MSSAHGGPLRGLKSAARSPKFEGRFGKMFHHLPPARYGKSEADSIINLMALGDLMKSDPDAPKDGADEAESAIPALYTYLGQFIDHDLTLGPQGSFQKVRDPD